MTWNSKVYFFFDKVKFTLRDRKRVKQIVELIFKNEKKKLSRVNYVFCNDNTLLAINQQYLEHNEFTDIITFDLSEVKKEIIGEVYISIERVEENASDLKIAFSREIKRVIIHGALHLCGYKDKSRNQKRQMSEKEEVYLSFF